MRLLIIFGLLGFCINSYGQLSDSVKTYLDSCRKVYEKNRKQAVGKPFKEFTVSNEGNSWSNANISGKVVYLYFGSYSTKTYRDELLYLNKVYAKFRNDSNFIFISMTTDSVAVIDRLKKEFDISYDIYPISFIQMNELNVSHSQPANIIIDKSGIIRYYECGAWSPNGNKRRYFKNKVSKTISRYLNNDW